MRMKTVVLATGILMAIAMNANACPTCGCQGSPAEKEDHEDHEHHGQQCSCAQCAAKKSELDAATKASPKADEPQQQEAKAINVGNKICPIMGNKIPEGHEITVEHKGKVYNLCCAGCIDKFKSDPEKYVEKVEAQETK